MAGSSYYLWRFRRKERCNSQQRDSLQRKMLAATMPNAQHIYRLAVDGEQYSVYMRLMA
jgi:hypothetical protein